MSAFEKRVKVIQDNDGSQFELSFFPLNNFALSNWRRYHCYGIAAPKYTLIPSAEPKNTWNISVSSRSAIV